MSTMLVGGLGNQLFQLAFAHLAKSNNPLDDELVRDPSPRIDRPLEVSHILDRCNHGLTLDKISNFQIKYAAAFRKFYGWLPETFRSLNLIGPKVVFEPRPFHFDIEFLNLPEEIVRFGYFQHWEYVKGSWNTFEDDLLPYMNDLIMPPSIPDSPDFVLHVRRGDLIVSKDTMGMLSDSYYLHALSELGWNHSMKNRTVIVTDDPQFVSGTPLRGVSNFILGPESLTAWQTLKVIMSGSIVMTANSTLSWWGGFLACQNNADVYIPNPWFRNWNMPIEDAFLFPGFHQVDAEFE